MLDDDGHEEIGLAWKQPVEGLLRNPAPGSNQIHGCTAIAQLIEGRARLRNDLRAARIVVHGFRTAARASLGGLIGLGCSFLCQHTVLTPTAEYD
ncbi:hypothetical protein ACXHMN_22625 [Rhizobium sp. LEGMi12c]